MIKNIKKCLLSALLLFTLASCDNSATSNIGDTSNNTDSSLTKENTKTLVAYFSWSGTTKEMATYINNKVNGTIMEIIPTKPYPTDYTETGNIAKDERDNNERPAIANLLESIIEYDNIFIGYPIWWHTAPMIIGTFLENYNLSNIDIYPFSQSASMDVTQFNNSMDFIKECAPGAIVHNGLFTRESNTTAIDQYLISNGFIN